MNIEIYVVAHKSYQMPTTDGIYVPVQVGFNDTISGFKRDDTGENIHDKNGSYCELTAQYWAWRNRTADVKGLVHYRRLFVSRQVHGRFNYDHVLGASEIQTLLSKYDVIVPKKRNYYIETLASHYKHSHLDIGLTTLADIIKRDFPSYQPAYQHHMQEKQGHMFNMLIAKGPVFDDYSKWLFEVLGKVEAKIDISQFSKSEQRIYGYLSELLLDVWLKTNHLSYVEVPVAFVEGENLFKKGLVMIKRKLVGFSEAKRS